MFDYDPHSWLDHLFDIKGSLVRQIFARVLLCGCWAVLITFLYQQQLLELAIPPTAHSLIGVALGLLLVFRTNASYDRFWEVCCTLFPCVL